MRIFFTLWYVVGVLVVKNSVSGKSSIFTKYSNGPHFDVEKQDDVAFVDSKNHLEKDNSEALINSFKRSADDVSSKWNDFENSIRKRSPYGLVYNQGKPIGILEPIPQSFEYSSYLPRDSSYRNSLYKSQWFPVKRDSDFEMDELEKEQLESQASAMHSNNYANVLAKFKVNNKVKHRPYQDFLNSQVKRAISVQDASRRKEMEDLKKRGVLDMGDLKANLKTKTKSSSTDESVAKEEANKVDEIEENLKDVMGDLGLVEKDKEAQSAADHQPNMRKREIYFEDEDLENGLNKIGFTKETHNDRNKKEDCPGKTKVAKSKGSRKYTVDKGLHKKGKKKVRKDDEAAKRSVRMNRKRIAEKKDIASIEPKMKIANYQYEGEEFIRRKRQEKEAEKTEDSDIMKGLEASGDLTVSGNKSPLVALSSNSEESELKKSQEKRDKEELEYEKRLERNIQAKINSIKEEVKREISKLRLDENKKDQQRKKREVTNTLLDEETSVLDPDLNIDHQLEPHIRRRRDANKQKSKQQEKRDLNRKENTKGQISISKMVREATKAKNVAKDHQRKSTQKVKRSNPEALEIKKESENEKPMEKPLMTNDDAIAKREDKTEQEEIKKIEKRGHQNHTLAEFNEEQADMAKNIEKRDNAFVATDKIETDIKTEFGTDAPGSIVKRNNDFAGLNENIQNKSIFGTGLPLFKRSEKHFDATTDKCLEATLESKSSSKNSEDENREGRSSNVDAISDLETGQTILKDIDLDTDREERQLTKTNVRDKENSKSEEDSTDSEGKQDEEEREERSPNVGRTREVENQEKLPVSHKTLRRNSESEKMEGDLIKSSIAEANANEELAVGKISNLFNAEQSDTALNEDTPNKEEGAVKKSDFGNDASDLADESSSVIEERSVDNHKMAMGESEDAADEGSSFGKRKKTFTKPSATNLQDTNNEEDNLTDEINEEVVPVGLRRKRRINNNRRYRNRRKRDENSYSENKNEMMNYRGDDGEVDDEDDEMHDDGFDDQTANFLSKRQADYDSSDAFEGGDEQETRDDDYPLYMERNKRNALRVYDDENDAEESYDNFLFYPNRYSRIKRHNYDNLAAIHGGVGYDASRGYYEERSMQPYEQNLRRKRLEKMQRMHDQNANVAELSDSDIFGGFPQSYEGELTRFKRVKRSYTK